MEVDPLAIQVVAIQPSERWLWETRNLSMWPLKGIGDAAHVPPDAKRIRIWR